jgi:hypothetical protein
VMTEPCETVRDQELCVRVRHPSRTLLRIAPCLVIREQADDLL